VTIIAALVQHAGWLGSAAAVAAELGCDSRLPSRYCYTSVKMMATILMEFITALLHAIMPISCHAYNRGRK
jgi:hypothetical protein